LPATKFSNLVRSPSHMRSVIDSNVICGVWMHFRGFYIHEKCWSVLGFLWFAC
jgi:hypothetical protein